MFIIRKKGETEHYSGMTWDVANIRHLYQPSYYSRTHAQAQADKLSEHNTVGFEVVDA